METKTKHSLIATGIVLGIVIILFVGITWLLMAPVGDIERYEAAGCVPAAWNWYGMPTIWNCP